MKNFEQVCRLVRQGLDDGAYPSACLSVGIRGSVCVRQTFGPARETTLYDIASLSKIVGTTMIAFRFLEEGRLRLYDTVEQFFPAPEDKKGITVLQLMTHTSGLPAHFYLSEEAEQDIFLCVHNGQRIFQTLRCMVRRIYMNMLTTGLIDKTSMPPQTSYYFL